MAKCGMKTEVYTRVCGYFRPVKNWNRGKQEEFKERKVYSHDSSMKSEQKEKVA
jgi:ribonucleoside-triphosphate reductase